MAPFREGADTPPSGPPPSQIQTAPNLVHFDPRAVVPSQTIYFQRNDQLGWSILTNSNNIALRINYRWLTPDGEIKEGELNAPPIAISAAFSFPLFEGWLLSFALRITSGSVPGQWLFAQAFITRGFAGIVGGPTSGLIWQGYVNATTSSGWPGTPSKEVIDGAGTFRTIIGTTPAAGAEVNESVPNNRRWQLLAFHARLVTNATVSNRNATLGVSQGGVSLFLGSAYLNHPASTTIDYSAAPFVDGTGHIAGFSQLDFLLPIPLRPGSTISTSTGNLQAGDQWSTVGYSVLEWGLWDQ